MIYTGLKIVLIALIPLTVSWSKDTGEDLAIIVHNSIDVQNISYEELLNIYTMRKYSWDDGSRITITDFKGNNEYRSAFYSYLHTDVTTIKKIWLRAQFTGKSTPPIIVRSVDEMIAIVMDNPGAIGYVPVTRIPENANVLLVIER